jgi:hypothetical protein
MSNSFTSFRESSNLCIFASSYLVVIWSYPCEDIYLVVISITSSCSSKSDPSFISYFDFDLYVFSVSHQVRYLTLLYLIHFHLVITNIFTFYRESHVVLFPTQLKLGRSELPIKSYSRLNICWSYFLGTKMR